jgi:hypothetical protein
MYHLEITIASNFNGKAHTFALLFIYASMFYLESQQYFTYINPQNMHLIIPMPFGQQPTIEHS